MRYEIVRNKRGVGPHKKRTHFTVFHACCPEQ